MPKPLHQLPTLAKDGAFNVVVESPRGSAVKLKYEPELEAFTVSHALAFGIRYPFDWGFVPSTKAPDGDPVDAMVLWEVPTYPGVVIPCRALGVLQVEQDDKKGGRERNDRLFATPISASRMENMRSIFDLSERDRDELGHFFLTVTHFARHNPKLLGWSGPEAAEALLRSSAR